MKPCNKLIPWSLGSNDPACNEGDMASLGWEYPMEKEMATHSRTFAWRIPWKAHGVDKEKDTTQWLNKVIIHVY